MPTPRTTIFLALEAETARLVHDTIGRGFAALGSGLHCRMQDTPAPLDGDLALARLLDSLGHPAALCTCHDLQRWTGYAGGEMSAVRTIYARSSLFLLQDLLDYVFAPTKAEPARLKELDATLTRSGPVLTAEAFHRSDDSAWRDVARLLDLPQTTSQAPLHPPAADCRPGNPRALMALLLGGAAAGGENGGTLHVTRAGGSGMQFLGEGWSDPESNSTWSTALAAKLTIPAALLQAHDLRLRGRLASRPGQSSGLCVRVDGVPVGTLTLAPGESHEILINLHQSSAKLIPSTTQVELQFMNPVRPCDAGLGDDARLLGMELRSIELQATPRGPDTPVPASPAGWRMEAGSAEELDFLYDSLVMDEVVRRPATTVLLLHASARQRRVIRNVWRRVAAFALVAAAPGDGSATEAIDAFEQADVCLVCDRYAFDHWANSPAFRGLSDYFAAEPPSIVVNTGDPGAVPYEVLKYGEVHQGVFRVSEHACIVSPAGTAAP